MTGSIRDRLGNWLFEGRGRPVGPHARPHQTLAWWQVMCLTGVDYFSTLGYQPSIAFLAVGVLSPFATLVLVLVTIFCALPIYRRVAELSPDGQGSIAMLEHLLPRWKGKALVLCLLGFAATDFIITITLSAADATAHIVENPFVPDWLDHPLLITLALLAVLSAIFLRGFKEAVGIAVGLVTVYLALTFVILIWGVHRLVTAPDIIGRWWTALWIQHTSPWAVVGLSLIWFPKLALGLSGFETGVAVMPLVRGEADDSPSYPVGRIHNTQKLLFTAATIMSVALIGSSLVTATLIPAGAFLEGQPANGRALAYLAHEHFGEWFGTVYDASTISILWFAGASAMAGLLNLVPRYLPRYGMAPEWMKANRPLVLIFAAITVIVTVMFDADVDAQGGAYATGVLVLITSGALATTLAAWRVGSGWRWFLVCTFVFAYTTAVNVVERPEGLKIATWFIVGIMASSLVSRVIRSTELRIHAVVPDETAASFVDEASKRDGLRVLANRPDKGTPAEYQAKLREARDVHHLPLDTPVVFLEIRPGDASAFSEELRIRGVDVGGFRVLRCESAAVPNAIAAFLLFARDRTQVLPHAYFGWTEGNPIAYLLKFLALGEGDTAPVTREVLRQAEPNPRRRPRVHVG